MSDISKPADSGPSSSRATLGLTGLTINAMALIAPGAFLWLTFQIQALYGAPMAGSAMWFGIVAALLLCFATAISYAELSKLYPGAGSSYFFAEQAFLSKTHAYKFARMAKFITGWASHLYYWVYPGCMVGVTALLSGYLLNQFWPDTFSGSFNSPALHVPLLHRVLARRRVHRVPRRHRHDRRQHGDQHHPDHRAPGLRGASRSRTASSTPKGRSGFHLENGTPIDFVVAQEPVMGETASPRSTTRASRSCKTRWTTRRATRSRR